MSESDLNYWRERAINLEMQLIKAARPSIGVVLQLLPSGDWLPLPILRLELRSDGAYDVIVGNKAPSDSGEGVE